MGRWGELARERPGEGLMHRHTACKKLKPYFMFSNLSSSLLTAIFNLIKEMERLRDLETERWSDGAMERWSDGAMERWGELARERVGEGQMHRHTACNKLKPYFMFSNLSSPLLTAIFNLIKEMERWGDGANWRESELAKV